MPTMLDINSSIKWAKNSVHEGIPYSCNKCDYKAIQKPNLNRHIKASNGGECVMMEISMLL